MEAEEEEVVVGMAGGGVVGDVDDGADFELNNALIHLPRGPQGLAPLPSNQNLSLGSVTATTVIAASLGLHTQSSHGKISLSGRSHHEKQQQQQSGTVLQCIAPAVPPPTQSQVVAKSVMALGEC